MKLLVIVDAIKSDLGDSGINYAVLDIDDKAKQYLTDRRDIFTTARALINDLCDMRFYGCPFITFYRNIDLHLIMDEDEEGIFSEQGYWELPENLNIVNCLNDEPLSQLVISTNSWYILAGYEEADITIQIPLDRDTTL